MKIRSRLLVMVALLTTLLEAMVCAQELQQGMNYEVRETHLKDDSIMVTSSRYVPAVSIYIPEARIADVQKAWKKKIRKNIQSKFIHQHNMFFLNQTVIKEISHHPVNVYFSSIQQDKEVKLTVGFELDSGFLSPSFMPDSYTNARSFMMTFGKEQYRSSIHDLVQEQVKKLNSLKQEMNRLFNKNKRLKALIKKSEIGISNLKGSIKENAVHVDMKTEEIGVRTQSLSDYSGELRKQKDKELKKLTQERKQLQTKAKQMSTKIIRYETAIKKAEHDIKLNLAQQEEQKERIQQQQRVVENLKNVQSAIN